MRKLVLKFGGIFDRGREIVREERDRDGESVCGYGLMRKKKSVFQYLSDVKKI